MENKFLDLGNIIDDIPVSAEEDDGAAAAQEVLNKKEEEDVLHEEEEDKQDPPDAEGSTEEDGADSDDGGTEEEKSEEEESEEGGDSEGSVYDVLKAKTGYEVEGDFEEDIDGLVNYVDKLSEVKAKEELDAMLERLPEAKQFIEFLESGGTPDQYFQVQHPETDYDKIEISEDNATQQKALIKHYLDLKGVEQDVADNLIQVYEDSETLHKQASKVLNELKAAQSEQKKAQLEAQKLQRQKAEEEQRAYWEEVQSTIESGNLGGFQIPQKRRKEFIEWMTKPVDRAGNTKRMLAQKELDMDKLLQLEYMIYKGFDLKEEIQRGAARKKADTSLKQFMGKKNKMKGGSSNAGDAGGAGEHIKDLGSILNG